jgi:hypothetical protein
MNLSYCAIHELLIHVVAYTLAGVFTPLQARLRIIVGNKSTLADDVRVAGEYFYVAPALRAFFLRYCNISAQHIRAGAT